MITIPEYVYEDDDIKFVCPALELAREDAARMLAALTDPKWPKMLRSEGYICHAFSELGVKTTTVSDALIEIYNCIALDGCLVETLPGIENWEKRFHIANLIRQSWSDHMRAQLRYIIAQG